ncbi:MULTISPECIES: hypothetical protein [Rhizobium]|uniref:Uncharacterized protein n=1 Tax=Rhizobium paranaense TaxID=1650438 RepID=A0A7W8XYF0_9HYPH|nr:MULTISPECIES: hypothetical protein [Rhizobium]MBB5577665.1 hypothetical protein [Rhizobium paranaense]PST64026.1 hypothetical protein C9E91_04950 [Rhizobium sp. SEMIA4064]
MFTQADLKMVDHHIAECEQQVLEQERKPTLLRKGSLDTELAEHILAAFYETLLIHYANRDMIAFHLDRKSRPLPLNVDEPG